ncbi:MAG: Cys-Gln thioester bond-forming surface protein, partial [Oscillospiraceae bacterium]|nr:Cys-Gln thioester bond-forming surface protein [Oscillospiraceae bacterium]
MHKKITALVLAFVMALSMIPFTAFAATIETSGSTTVTVKMGERNSFLKDSTGKALGGSYWEYTTNKENIKGPAYCINHGLKAVPDNKTLPIKNRYEAGPKVLGAFASGYPQVTLADFIADNNLPGLTEPEYEYATQVAVWAALGQLGIEGTQFMAGSQQVKNPSSSGDAQQIRVFKAVQAILAEASKWTQNQWRGMYMRWQANVAGGFLDLYHDDGLAGLAMTSPYVELETIGGIDYYTVVYWVSSATPTKPNGNCIDVTPYGPTGTMLVNADTNAPLQTIDKGAGTTTYRVPTTGPIQTDLNANGVEYRGKYKLCIPADNAAASGKVEITSSADVTQYELYIAYNGTMNEQSYIIADPSVGLIYASGAFSWSSDETEEGALQITKTDGQGWPLGGATFELRGASGYAESRTTDETGVVLWENLDPDDTYMLYETVAPPGYTPLPPMPVSIGANITTYATLRNDNAHKFFIRKLDKQNNRVLQGAVFELKQVDGSFQTTGVTRFDGILEFDSVELPFGVYEVRELSAPEGYLRDTSVQTVNWSGEADVYLTFLNVREPGITLIKLSEDGQPLADAVFNVYKDGQLIGSVTTDYNGVASFMVPEDGEGYYEFEEVSAPFGFVLDSTKIGIHFDPYNPATDADPVVIAVNKAKPYLLIMKIDASTGEPVGGVTFEVYKNTALIGSYTTGYDGEVMIAVDPGVYLVKEVGVPAGYVLNTTPQEIEILAGDGVKQLVFLNDPEPGIYILKVDEATGEFLANAEFSVERNGGQIIWQGMTDSTGIIFLDNLEPGWVVIKELAAPYGYLKRDEEKNVLLEPGKVIQVKFDNRERPKLEILKIDAVTKQPLSGATFKVQKTEDKTVSEYVTGADGHILIENLDEAVYTVEEVTSPDGYILDTQHKEIALEWGKTKTLVYEDVRKPTLIITKTNALTYTPIPDTTYRVERDRSDGGVQHIGTYRTDKNGQVILKHADPGWYTITETLPAPGFTPASNPEIRRYLTPGENAYTTFEAALDGAGGDVSGNNILVTSGSDYIRGYEIINYPLNSIVIRKADIVTGELLSGAVFELRQVNEEVSGSSGTLIGRYTTDSSGTIVITGLIPGGFIVEEVQAPANYMLSENSTQQVWLKPDGTSIVETTFANIPYGAILITKVDAQTNKPLGNARFRVTDSSGAVVGNTNGEYITDENGEILIPNVRPGSFVITEIEAPAFYAIDTTPQTVQVGMDGKIYRVGFKNQPYGGLLITKVDAVTNTPLANARFKVTDSSGAVVGNTNGEYITDSNGEIMIPNVRPGAVVVTELEAPEYYAIDTTPQTIDVYADGKVYKVSFKNQPTGTLVIRKLDTVTREPLADAVFKVTASDGSVVGTSNGIFRTDATGTIIIPHLPKGGFVAQEIESPEGYLLENQSQTIEIDYGKSYTLDFYNRKMSGAQIIKIDSITKQPIKGVKFTVYRMDGGIVGVYETDANGVIVLDALEPGWYKTAESKAVEGYLIDDKPQDFQITANQFVKLVFENAPMSGLLIRKVDADTREPLEGAEFTVRAVSGQMIGVYRSDEDGLVYIPAIEPGFFQITESAAPEGYTLGDTNVQTVQVTNSKIVTVEFRNRAFGSIVIKKIDEITGDPLTGAVFTVSKQGGAFVGEYTTGKDGTVSIPSVEPGWFLVSEQKAPAGYILSGTAKTVEVKPVVPSIVTVTNKPLSGIQILKFDAQTKAPLTGATFLVERDTGERIGSYKTDSTGKILVSDLTE